MPARRPRFAKLTRPRTHAPVARERLFHALDQLRALPLIWIEGPPGAGKTTLAATYLEQAGLGGIWYQLDSGDADPATFFYYLREAAQPWSRGRAQLALLTPEYLADLPGFGRRFFREIFLRLPAGAVITFDNYQEVPADSRLHAVFATALEEVPPGAGLIVISRTAPLPELARAIVGDKVARLAWEDLRLTLAETRAIAASRGGADEAMVELLFEQSNGWTAGVMLLLERARRDGVLYAAQTGGTLNATFDYFASQIFDPLPEETRELLMSVSLLPQVTTAAAVAITGDANAGRVLEFLYHRHLFVDRRPGEVPTYQFHALFRAFLRHRAGQQFGPKRLQELRLSAAELLAASGQDDDAFLLLAEAEQWERAAELTIRAAPSLIGQGRWQTLQDWVSLMPAAQREQNPRLRYWLGRALAPVNPLAARSGLAAAYDAFLEAGDSTWQLLCAAAVLEALCYEFTDFKLMDAWIERVAASLARGTALASQQDELQVNCTLILALTYRDPDHPMLGQCAGRVSALITEPFDVNLRVTAAGTLQRYSQMTLDRGTEAMAMREGPTLAKAPGVTPSRAVFYWVSEAYTHYAFARYAEALACYDRADAIAIEQGLDGWALVSGCLHGYCERRAGPPAAAAATLARLENLRKVCIGYRLALFEMLKGMVAYDHGDREAAGEAMVASRRASEQAGQFLFLMLGGTVSADILVAVGWLDEAAKILARERVHANGPVTGQFLAAIALLEARLAHRQGDMAVCEARLREALLHARDDRTRVRLRGYPAALAELLPMAFARGIEPQTARLLARELDIVPLALDLEEWPWPIKVYTLGRFELLRNGQPLAFTRKAPKKSLALLQAIVAFGGREVPEGRLIEALWPNEDGDAGHRALGTALYRLRKLLGDAGAIRQHGTKLTLDPQRCWVDAIAFERSLEAAQADAGDGTAAGQRALALYRGPFLALEDSAAWALPAQERLRARFIQAVSTTTARLEAQGRFDAAIDCYLRGLDADHLVEPFYQGLMRAYGALQRHAEVASVYRRLERTLSVVLGVPPSSASEKLYRELRVS
jgi:LuxR family maltose regulon positive regulatory protein